MKAIQLVLGNQLFSKQYYDKNLPMLLIEDQGLCEHFKYHKLKIIFFLAAMRHFRDEFKSFGFEVFYHEMEHLDRASYEIKLGKILQEKHITKIIMFEIEDRFFEQRLEEFCASRKIELEIKQSPMFLTSRDEFKAYLARSKKPFMKTFYESQRKRFKILVDNSGKPTGGRWSFDEENRKKIPHDLEIPVPRPGTESAHVASARQIVQREFSNHPGESAELWLAVTRAEAKKELKTFVRQKLENFGPYEDAMTTRSDFVFHSRLSALLNTGLLTPQKVLAELKEFGEKAPLASLEGFIRQVIGWREFVRGIYQNFDDVQRKTNYWKAKRKLNPCWYDGTTGIEPVDLIIQKINRLGYAHHIERLMVFGNLFLLTGIHPHEAYRWFMEMFVDSSDWVMGPNVFGMGIFSDGGVFATKPYICGSNYWLKMSDFKKGQWCDIVDGLYWRFIDRERAFFSTNPRLQMMVNLFDKMDKIRKEKILALAEQFIEKVSS